MAFTVDWEQNEWISFAVAARVYVAEDRSSFDVCPKNPGSGPTFTVETLHISCQSDTYRGSKRMYGGIIIYGRNSQGDWRTANGTHCKSGYVVIMQTDTREFQEMQKKWNREPGQVHGVIYRKAFGESLNDVKVVGEGFGVVNGEFKFNSGALNPSHGDDYHDNSYRMHKDSARFVKALFKKWKKAGPRFRSRQNYSLQELGN